MKYWLTSLLFTLSLNVLANSVVIYRWVDKNNVVHFSQNQPATANYTEVVMANSSRPNLQKNNIAKPIIPSTVTSKNNVSKKLTADSSEQCEEAKKNLETLVGFD